VGHHAFYLKLDGTFTGSKARQQLAHTFGNILAISAAACFAIASRAVYKQYFWTVCIFSSSPPPWRNKFCNELPTHLDIFQVVQRSSFTINALDRLYSLTSDLLSSLMLKSGSRRLSQYFWHWLAGNLALLTSLTISNTVQVINTYPFPSARNFDCSCRYSHGHKSSANARS
jgi:hypothetical protein